ncbi:MAG: hypothetical protein MHMPM18_001810 [Marteilia pararefringens]
MSFSNSHVFLVLLSATIYECASSDLEKCCADADKRTLRRILRRKVLLLFCNNCYIIEGSNKIKESQIDFLQNFLIRHPKEILSSIVKHGRSTNGLLFCVKNLVDNRLFPVNIEGISNRQSLYNRLPILKNSFNDVISEQIYELYADYENICAYLAQNYRAMRYHPLLEEVKVNEMLVFQILR